MSDNAFVVTEQLADAYNRKDWTAFADLLHANAFFEAPDPDNGVERHEGIDAILEFLKDWTAIIPDAKATFISSRLVGDDRVVCEVVWSGTHSGRPFEWADVTVPANGNAITIRGSTEYMVRNGKITRIIDQIEAGEFLAGFGIRSS
jgi:predicted ester cyclase